ncbi:hypothetical protein CBR_g41551 [Chara braunii]|uniref:DUF659 domain-containing protein n=1 Tax=Chara braunii TaxID=69332 RepID=A0A388K2S2_CHABU|nr:hypothetical protein CBR_g41551 [Chara braunii]|eukprot:GBG64350.1 hypothetical protein CBR_g41551 [Chara braunii]
MLEEGGAIVSKNEEAQRSIDDWLVFDRVPFTLVRSKYFLRLLQKVPEAERSFIPAKSNVQRTKKLDLSEARVTQGVARQQKRWARTGCMLLLDGWTDWRGRPRLNVMVSFPTCVVFWKSHCMSGKEKGSEAYFNILSESIKEVSDKVAVGVIMDNAAVCARAGKLVEDTFSTIFHVPCTAHCLDLMPHDIGRTDWVEEVVGKGNDLVKFFMNRQRVRDIFYVHSGGRQLLRPAATRFTTNFHMLDRLKKQRNALVATVSHDARWKPAVVPHAQSDTFYEMEEIVLDGAGFWEGVNKVISAVYDIVLLLKVVDGTGPTVSKVYAKMDKVLLTFIWTCIVDNCFHDLGSLQEDWRGLTKAGMYMASRSQRQVCKKARSLGTADHMRRHMKGGGGANPRGTATTAQDVQQEKRPRGRPRKNMAPENGEASNVAAIEEQGTKSQADAKECIGSEDENEGGKGGGGAANPRGAATAAQVVEKEKRPRGRPQKNNMAPENGEASNVAAIEERGTKSQADEEECNGSEEEHEGEEGEDHGLQRKVCRDRGQSEQGTDVAIEEQGTKSQADAKECIGSEDENQGEKGGGGGARKTPQRQATKKQHGP